MRLLCLERDTVVRCVRGGARPLPVGVMRCAWLSRASKGIFFFFWFSDSDHIEPFVSRQTDVYTQFNLQHFLSLLQRSLKAEGCRF